MSLTKVKSIKHITKIYDSSKFFRKNAINKDFLKFKLAQRIPIRATLVYI